DFSPAFQAFRGNADALYVAIDQLMVANLMRILTLALGARLPTIFSTRDFVRGGDFMSYGPETAPPRGTGLSRLNIWKIAPLRLRDLSVSLGNVAYIF